jgi:hypothetical protein
MAIGYGEIRLNYEDWRNNVLGPHPGPGKYQLLKELHKRYYILNDTKKKYTLINVP